MQTIGAKWFGVVRNIKGIDLVVVHSMEAPDKPDTAEAVARYFQNLPASNKASAHICADSNSMVRCVPDNVVAYAAPGANANGVHIELTGYAAWARGQWQTPTMVTMLGLAAQQIRDWCDTYGVPKRFVDAAALKRGERGITTHFEVSQAFHQSTHTDPGKGFPITDLVARVAGTPGPSIPGVPMVDLITKAIEPVSSVTVELPGGALGGYLFGRRGHVYAFDGAMFFGNWSEDTAGPVNRSGRDCVALVPTATGLGYWLVSDAGEVYSYGDAQWPGNYQSEWGQGFPITGAYRNGLIPGCGGVTLVRDDGQAINLYRLPA